MVARRNLTDRFIRSLKPAPTGKREVWPDAIVPGLAIRVTDRRHRSFVLLTRYPGSVHPAPRTLGDYGEVTLEQARAKARAWLELLGKGIDPRVQEARERAAAQRDQASSFAHVANEFIERHCKKLRKYEEAKSVIESEFVARWAARPIGDVRTEEISRAIKAIVARGAPYSAHNALGYLRRMYSWAIGTHEFGDLSSPVDRLRPRDLIGARESRDRVLSDCDVREVWFAAGALGYPYAPLFQLLILTAQRESEVAEARWCEFDPHLVALLRNRSADERIDWSNVDQDHKLWTIPAERMKGKRAHEVPLTNSALQLLETLPHLAQGDYLFSTLAGRKPVNGFSKTKRRVDILVEAALREGLSDQQSRATAEPLLEPWVIHDLRRTARTRFSALPVEDIVRELVIAHTKKGLHKTYDLHAYRDEKRECLTLWEERLKRLLKSEVALATPERERRNLPREREGRQQNA